jgi:hypothetical protein
MTHWGRSSGSPDAWCRLPGMFPSGLEV